MTSAYNTVSSKAQQVIAWVDILIDILREETVKLCQDSRREHGKFHCIMRVRSDKWEQKWVDMIDVFHLTMR